MAKVEVQVEQWQERAIQVMVLLSFTMQLMLLVLAEFRRRIDSGVLRAVIWSAYMMADSTAIYTLGHLSVTSRSADHELMAFWAPFLLLHLGGQDNITAYAIEDNRLWLRHLQALAVQVAAAAYVLYESTLVSTQALLRNASILMFVVGVLKYGERVWALKRAGTSASGNNYQYFEKTTQPWFGPPTDRRDTEGLLRIAHLLLDVPKNLLQGPLPNVVVCLAKDNDVIPTDELYKIVEMQLSLMYDVVYSKAEVIHTWYGLCIRVISPVFTAVAFVLFHRSGLSAGSHYSRADDVITYVLLVGAVTLEMVSVLRAMFSRWSSVTLGKLAYMVGEERRVWGLLARAVASIRQFVLPKRDGSRWWWSGSMGQHNLVDLCVGSRASRASRTAGWMGIEDWWNKMVYSSSIPVSTTIKDLVVKQVVSMVKDTDHIIISRGEATLKKWGLYNELKGFLGMDLGESILVWHITTDIYLREHRNQWKATAADDNVLHLAEATEAISNYMLFLLAVRPYMLPDSVSRTKYVEMCYCLTSLKYTTAQDLSSLLMLSPSQTPTYDCMYYRSKYLMDHIEREGAIRHNDTLKAARELASDLVYPEPGPPAAKLEMIAQVWTEILCYAGYRCSGYSHAKQLSSGGELLTIAALLVECYRTNVLKPLSRKEEKEEEERRAGNHGAAGNLKAMKEIALQPTRTEPRSPSSGSSDEISPV